MNVRESYSSALDQGTLLSSSPTRARPNDFIMADEEIGGPKLPSISQPWPPSFLPSRSARIPPMETQILPDLFKGPDILLLIQESGIL